LFPPEAFYSYSSVGYHVLGYLIEAIRRKTFRDVLCEEVLSVLSSKCELPSEMLYRVEPQPVCPASGAGLQLSGRLLFVFAKAMVESGGKLFGLDEEITETFMTPVVTAPGWSPFLIGAGLGWKDYGHGWFGHNGGTDRSLLILRVNSEGKHIVTASGISPSGNRGLSALCGSLVKRTFPSLCEASIPPIRPGERPTSSERQRTAGRFGGPLFTYAIVNGQDKLTLEISAADTDGVLCTVHSCPLIKGEQDVYFMQRPWKTTYFVQIVHDSRSGLRYLWDHESVWPELGPQ
jgi:hypothetical protein